MAVPPDFRDFFRTIEAIEDEHRHDLLVHLYLAFLLHRINPFFPPPKWSAWPLPLDKVPDPRELYEDFAVDELFRQEHDENSEMDPKEIDLSNLIGEDMKFKFKRARLKVVVAHKRQKLSNSKALVVNEIHSLLERTIRKKVSGKNLQLSLEPNSKVTKHLALQLANKLNKVLAEVAQSTLRKKQSLKTWQDILIANLMHDHGEVLNVASCKTIYEKAREMFVNPQYNYQYDAFQYGSDLDTEVPEFDVEEHLQAIEDEEALPVPRPALEVLKGKTEEATLKENLYVELWNQRVRASQLSWKDCDRQNMDKYKPEGSYSSEKKSALAKDGVGFSSSSFEVAFTL